MTLATEASNTGLSTSQSTAIDTEFQALLTEIGSIGSSTNFNGTAVFGSTVSAYTTDGTASGTVNISANVASPSTLASGLAATSLTGATPTAGATNAQSALAVITAAISTVSSQRGTLGATVEQLQAASTVDTDESQNLQSASSETSLRQI